MRHLSAIILVLFLVVFPSCKYFQGGKKARALAAEQARQDSIRVSDSIRKAQAYLLSIENARLDSLRRADEQRLASESKYNIIVGSFITPEFAKEFAGEFSRMGYDVQIIQPGASKFELVVAERHNDLRTAIKRLAAFQDTVQIDSWIYIRN